MAKQCSGTEMASWIHFSKAAFYGSNFKIDGQPFSFGTYSVSDLPPKSGEDIFTLTGYFENGSSFSCILLMISEEAQITFIPEPATLSLLGIGGLMLRQRKR